MAKRKYAPTAITVAELRQRGMDDRLRQIINTLIGNSINAPEWLNMTAEERMALGYGTPCPCGERGLLLDEKLCGCGDSCEECCKNDCMEDCDGNCECKVINKV